jgi:hypothetical protein
VSAILGRLQRALEALYRIDRNEDVRDFVISGETRAALGVERAPGEQLLLRQDPESRTLDVGLFVDELALRRLAGEFGEERLPEYLLAVEGVSHFVYVMARARAERPFSALELELQAEVDKYLLSLLGTWPHHGPPPTDLRKRLFKRVHYHADLTDEERDRYKTANDAADEYCGQLEHRYVRRRAVDDMLGEVRRFWRLDCGGKLDHIVKKAA